MNEPASRAAQAAAPAAAVEQLVLGTWRLVAWEARDADGTVSQPFGDQAVGFIVYTVDRHFFAQLMRLGLLTFVGNDVLGGTAEENASALGGYVAYAGTYAVQDGMMVHRVEMSLFPNWIGSQQRRTIEWNAGHLILSSPPLLGAGRQASDRLTWERVVSETGA
ncbi:MAG: lipocalin-like domain-containing protein [Chloroflexi bacterium]|nr:lipocalin-like domain-containing protein [Chloroflexota bacterium]